MSSRYNERGVHRHGQDLAIDDTDILRNYDAMMTGILRVPVSQDRYWALDELALMDLAELQAIAQPRGIDPATTNTAIWIKHILNSQRVPVHFASARPGWSSQEWTTGPPPNITIDEMVGIPNVQFPAMAVWRTGHSPDWGRWSAAPVRCIEIWGENRGVYRSRRPIPVNFAYQVDVLALEMRHINQISLWMARRFWETRASTVEVHLGSPWGMRAGSVQMSGMTDTSNLVANSSSSQAEKLLRQTYTFGVEGWIPGATVMTRMAEEVQYTLEIEEAELVEIAESGQWVWVPKGGTPLYDEEGIVLTE